MEVLVTIAIAVLVLFLFIRFVMAYIARRRMWKEEKEQMKEKWLEPGVFEQPAVNFQAGV